MMSTARTAVCFAPKTHLRVAAARRTLVVRAEGGTINPDIKKDVDKVVDFVTPKDLAGKPQAVYCRCWRSKTFPLCDGSHVKHNSATGDNVGPLIIKSSD